MSDCEIKFRLPIYSGNGSKRKFYSWHYWGFIRDSYGLIFKGVPVEAETALRESLTYTGFRDRKGKEIYEDDFLRASEVNPVIEKVFWNNSAGQWQLLSGGYSYPLSCYASSHEVVGNMVENPELMKVMNAK